MRRLSRISALALLVAVLALTGCDEGNPYGGAMSFYISWRYSQGPADLVLGDAGRTGQEAVDGLFDAARVMDFMDVADREYEEAKRALDRYQPGDDLGRAAAALDYAIDTRPEDMRYWRERARLSLLLGDPEGAKTEWNTQDDIAAKNHLIDDLTYWQGVEWDAKEATVLYTTDLPGASSSPGGAYDDQLAAAYTREADALQSQAEIIRDQGGDPSLALREMEVARSNAEAHGGD